MKDKFRKILDRMPGCAIDWDFPDFSEFRISKLARWAFNFTPPTKTFGATSGTFNGSSQVTWQNSLVNNGSSYTITCDNSNFEFGKKDFTIDFFVRFEETNHFLTKRFLRRN